MLKDLQKLSIIILLLCLAGCTTLATDRDWPSDVPKRQIFVDKFLESRGISKVDPKVIDVHLSWITRFYQGTVLFPNGWNRVSERFLASIDQQDEKDKMAKRLYSLGLLIANEWAQDNDIRKVNNANVATWGGALRTSAERNDQSNFISKVERDVEALIAGTLTSSQIDYERYYPSEDYDDF